MDEHVKKLRLLLKFAMRILGQLLRTMGKMGKEQLWTIN